jgi:uncharacterized DUF497 family protein
MTRPIELEWAADRDEHISRHGVSREEVEEVLLGSPYVTHARNRRLRLIGQTDAGRYLTIIVGRRRSGRYGLITARDATQTERRDFWRHRRRS